MVFLVYCLIGTKIYLQNKNKIRKFSSHFQQFFSFVFRISIRLVTSNACARASIRFFIVEKAAKDHRRRLIHISLVRSRREQRIGLCRFGQTLLQRTLTYVEHGLVRNLEASFAHDVVCREICGILCGEPVNNTYNKYLF